MPVKQVYRMCQDKGARPTVLAVNQTVAQLMAGWGRLKRLIAAELAALGWEKTVIVPDIGFGEIETGFGRKRQLKVDIGLQSPGSPRTSPGVCVARIYSSSDGQFIYKMNSGCPVRPEVIAKTVVSRFQIIA